MVCIGHICDHECLLTVNKSPAGDVTGEAIRHCLASVGKFSDSHVAIVVHRLRQSHDGNVISDNNNAVDEILFF